MAAGEQAEAHLDAQPRGGAVPGRIAVGGWVVAACRAGRAAGGWRAGFCCCLARHCPACCAAQQLVRPYHQPNLTESRC